MKYTRKKFKAFYENLSPADKKAFADTIPTKSTKEDAMYNYINQLKSGARVPGNSLRILIEMKVAEWQAAHGVR